MSTQNEARLTAINSWLDNLYVDKKLEASTYLESDASARKYLRCILHDKPYIVMDTVPGAELNTFIKIAQILTENRINAPQILHADLEQGLLLMNDFGDDTYLNVLRTADHKQIQQLYTDALETLLQIQLINKDAYTMPVMDSDYIVNRLGVFKEWYLQKHLSINTDHKTEQMLQTLLGIFTATFSEFPQVFVHVDYHCRNIMHVSGSNKPGILDFQDAMYGPITYDLVSLFQDAYITWPRDQVEQWVQQYYEMALQAGILQATSANLFLRNFDLVGLQRHIKNLGIFARLHHRDNKSKYLRDMPTLQKYISETCAIYPELAAVQQYFSEYNILEERVNV